MVANHVFAGSIPASVIVWWESSWEQCGHTPPLIIFTKVIKGVATANRFDSCFSPSYGDISTNGSVSVPLEPKVWVQFPYVSLSLCSKEVMRSAVDRIYAGSSPASRTDSLLKEGLNYVIKSLVKHTCL